MHDNLVFALYMNISEICKDELVNIFEINDVSNSSFFSEFQNVMRLDDVNGVSYQCFKSESRKALARQIVSDVMDCSPGLWHIKKYIMTNKMSTSTTTVDNSQNARNKSTMKLSGRIWHPGL